MHHLGDALIWASAAGVVCSFMYGISETGRAVTMTTFLAGSAGWLLLGIWQFAVPGFVFSAVLGLSGLIAARGRRRDR